MVDELMIFPKNKGIYNKSAEGSYFDPPYGAFPKVYIVRTEPIRVETKSIARELRVMNPLDF